MVTLEELSQYYQKYKCIERNEEMLKSLEAAAAPGAQLLTGMPRVPGIKDKVGDLATEIQDLKKRIDSLRKELKFAYNIVDKIISTIEDDQTRMIFRLRFLYCLDWGGVAVAVGGRNTAGSVKMICYRYINRH